MAFLYRALGTAALALALAPGSALAEHLVEIIVDGDVLHVPESVDENGVATIDDWVAQTSEYQITLTATLDPDPQIVYAAAVIDFGAPSVFGFVFALPIVPTPAPGFVTHSESSSTTDAGGVAGTPVTALPPIGIPVDGDLVTEQFVYTLSQNGGGLLLNAGLDIRGSFAGASPSDTQAAINLGPIAGPAGAGFYDYMRIDVNFSMTGGGDAYTFNGIATVVPEPAAAALFGLGLGGLALFGRRRR
jgi:hypothetical protein